MNKICTTIEQSKKLIELGIDTSTADMCYDLGGGEEKAHLECDNFITYFTNDEYPEMADRYIPAWSLSALLDLIQWDYKLEKTLFDQSDLFTYSIVCNDLDYRTYEHDNEPLDAAFEMVCWLKENGKL